MTKLMIAFGLAAATLGAAAAEARPYHHHGGYHRGYHRHYYGHRYHHGHRHHGYHNHR